MRFLSLVIGVVLATVAWTKPDFDIVVNDYSNGLGYLWKAFNPGDVAVCGAKLTLVNIIKKSVTWSVPTPSESGTNHACTLSFSADSMFRSSSSVGIESRWTKDGSVKWTNANLLGCYGPTYSADDDVVYVTCPQSSPQQGLFVLDPKTGAITYNDTTLAPLSGVYAPSGYLVVSTSNTGLVVKSRPDYKTVWYNTTLTPSAVGSRMSIALSPFDGDSFFLIWTPDGVSQTVSKLAVATGNVDWDVGGFGVPVTQTTAPESFELFAAGNFDVLVYNGTRVVRMSSFGGSISSQTPANLDLPYGDSILVDQDTILHFWTAAGGPLLVQFDGFGNFEKNITMAHSIIEGTHIPADTNGNKNTLVFLTVGATSFHIEGLYIPQ